MVADLSTAAAAAAQRLQFSGVRFHTIDAKWRLTLPAEWRPGDLGRIVLSPHSERDCILGLPQATYLDVIDQINANTEVTEEEKYDFISFFSSINEPANIDAANRISLPEALCDKYSLKKGDKAVLLGTNDRFEIFSMEEWERRRAATEATFKKLSKLVRV